jgi:plastocyanin/predicted thioesterase
VRRIALTTLIVLAGLAGPAAAQMGMGDGGPGMSATGPRVGIAYAAFAPPQIDVVAGDTVTWTNSSLRKHTVTADSGAFSSAELSSSQGFSWRFDTPGSNTYYCRLHTSMTGEIDVHRVLLDAPREPGAPGRAYGLTGRAALPAGEQVAIQSDPGDGGGFRDVSTAAVDGHGAFAADVVPATTATYRAVVEGEASPPVALLVLDRHLAAAAATHGRGVSVTAHVAPASPGATVVLQLRLHERFGWWPVARARLDRGSQALLRTRLSRRAAARVVLTLADGATVLATSTTLHVGRR